MVKKIKNNTCNNAKVVPIDIVDEMKTAYIDYSMSVIISRALPDVRDGLKPVHRRVLYGMYELNLYYNKSYKKSARIVGEVLGKYHPHGDTSVYDSMVRMTQNWILRYPLINGQGNFGSIDGDNAAAMRYTEVKLSKVSNEMLSFIDFDTVDFKSNFDESLKEPKVLPSMLPNLIINGSSGIAVGMATNMPPHNISESIDAIMAFIDNEDISINDIMSYIKAPDFPTGGVIYGLEGVKKAFETGKGKIILRGKVSIDEYKKNYNRIIVNEIPYMVNKSHMIIKTSELINKKQIEGISSIRDESDRNGLRIVYEVKYGYNPLIILNNLYKYTSLEVSFNVNNIALVNEKPELLNIKDLIKYFYYHINNILIKKTKYILNDNRNKIHILDGYLAINKNIDLAINLIKKSYDINNAYKLLIENFQLSLVQAKSILDLKLNRLTKFENDKILNDYKKSQNTINECEEIINNNHVRKSILKAYLNNIKNKYGDERRTKIILTTKDTNIEDLIPQNAFIITISCLGYIKRTATIEYKRQIRGGRGVISGKLRDGDSIEHIITAYTHNWILFFTKNGKCYWLKVYDIPESNKNSKGRAIQNIININKNDKVQSFITIENFDSKYLLDKYVIICTKNGIIKKTSLNAYSKPRINGIKAIIIKPNDELLAVKLSTNKSEIFMASKLGYSVKFDESTVRCMNRLTSGVVGMRLSKNKDIIVGMVIIDNKKSNILAISENGYGKRTHVINYRQTHRGTKGVKVMNINDKTGNLVSVVNINSKDDLMIINKSGVSIRMSIFDIRIMGRATQGVKLIKLKNKDKIASVTKIPSELNESNSK